MRSFTSDTLIDMNSLPLISSSPILRKRVSALVHETLGEEPEVVPLETPDQAVDYLRTGLPELILLDFREEATYAVEVLEAVGDAPWLIHRGIVALEAEGEADDRLRSNLNHRMVERGDAR